MNELSDAAIVAASSRSEKTRLAKYDWTKLSEDLNSHGYAVIDRHLSPKECSQIAGLYSEKDHFRSHIDMARHGFGKGEYRYFKYPLPALLSELRTTLYPRIAAIANSWNERMSVDRRYPDRHADFLKQCHDAGQKRPTPLLLQYVPGDFNCLHQDLYGELCFRCRWRFFFPNPAKTSLVASLC
jgi:uncharacterized protein